MYNNFFSLNIKTCSLLGEFFWKYFFFITQIHFLFIDFSKAFDLVDHSIFFVQAWRQEHQQVFVAMDTKLSPRQNATSQASWCTINNADLPGGCTTRICHIPFTVRNLYRWFRRCYTCRNARTRKDGCVSTLTTAQRLKVYQLANYKICRRYLTAFRTGQLRITCHWTQRKPRICEYRSAKTLLSRIFYEEMTRVWRGYPILSYWEYGNKTTYVGITMLNRL